MPKTAVVALGGNAITRSGQSGTYAEQAENARAMARAVCALRDAGWNVVLVHGNGPQVGNLAIQQEEAAGIVPALPLHCVNSMTQGQLGSLISLALLAEGHGRLTGVVSVVTHVIVDPDDPAFGRPTKPVGPFFSEEQASALAADRGWSIVRDGDRGHRRVVPSPKPVGIVEVDAIRALIDQHMIVVAGGGGGIPVIAGDRGMEGIDAVIDKDLTAQRIATSVNAEALVLVTEHAEGAARLRQGDPARAHRDDRGRRDEVPRRRPVPGRQHGPEGPGRDPVRPRGRRDRRDHHGGTGRSVPGRR